MQRSGKETRNEIGNARDVVAAIAGIGVQAHVILDHHGARLEVASEPLRGATFRVGFPLAADAGPTAV